MKAYCANEKPFVYAAFSGGDGDQATAILQKLNADGVLFWFSDRFSKKEIRRIEAASACMLFLSGNSIGDPKVQSSIHEAVRHNKKILCVYLEPTALSPGNELQLNSLQSISMCDFSDEAAFLEKLRSAEIFRELQVTSAQKRFARRRGLASVLVPIASAIGIFTAVVVPLLVIPSVQAASGSLSKVGFGNLSLSELAKRDTLYVIGHNTYDRWYFAHYKGSQTEVVVNDLNKTLPTGDISDISDLALLKNAREIAFEANQISDISPLYKIKSLESLTLNCNPLRSIEGIEALQNLKNVTLVCTDVSDISPLFKIHSLQTISFENTYVSSIAGIENLNRLMDLRTGNSNLTDISPLNKIDFSYLNGDQNGFGFEAKNTLVKDFSPLQRIPKFKEIMMDVNRIDSVLPYIAGKQVLSLYIGKSDIRTVSQLASIQNLQSLQLPDSAQLSYLEGIESHPDLRDVNLANCLKLTDLTPLLKLPRLENLVLTAKMQALAVSQLQGARFNITYLDK